MSVPAPRSCLRLLHQSTLEGVGYLLNMLMLDTAHQPRLSAVASSLDPTMASQANWLGSRAEKAPAPGVVLPDLWQCTLVQSQNDFTVP